MNSLYGQQIKRDFDEKYACKSEYWMSTEYDDRTKCYWRLSNGNYIVQMIDDEGLEDEAKS